MADEVSLPLLQEIAEACERAYRRGFQHGVCAAEREGIRDGVEVFRWRYSPTKKTLCPPGMDPCPMTVLERLRVEHAWLKEETPLLSRMIRKVLES